MFYFMLGLLNAFLLYSYVAMGVWFLWRQRNSGMSLLVRIGMWLISPVWVLVDWALTLIPPFEKFMWNWTGKKLRELDKDK
jgi:hypothetical protein